MFEQRLVDGEPRQQDHRNRVSRLTGGDSPRCAVVRDGARRQAVVPEDFLALRQDVSLRGVGLLIRPGVLQKESIQGSFSAIETVKFVILRKLLDGAEAAHSSW